MSKKILDYEEMMEKLDSFKGTCIEKQKPIGYSYYKYPIVHYTYGKGPYHFIMTAGTHGTELITNIFVLHFMSELASGKIKIDKEKYTIHFLPIVNPEGTILVTSAIRSLITREADEKREQDICRQYYLNAKLEDEFAEQYDDHDNKLQHHMFRHTTLFQIDEAHSNFAKNIETILRENKLPIGVLISWKSNGRGVDLNCNLETGHYLEEYMNGAVKYGPNRDNIIPKHRVGPLGCPSYSKAFTYEKENEALFRFYSELSSKYTVLGSFIYHSCGGIIYYIEGNVPKKLEEKEIEYNRTVAKKYGELTRYTLCKQQKYTTVDMKLKQMIKGSLLIELGQIRATPLSQFIEEKYDPIMQMNTKATLQTLEEMYILYKKMYTEKEVL